MPVQAGFKLFNSVKLMQNEWPNRIPDVAVEDLLDESRLRWMKRWCGFASREGL